MGRDLNEVGLQALAAAAVTLSRQQPGLVAVSEVEDVPTNQPEAHAPELSPRTEATESNRRPKAETQRIYRACTEYILRDL